MIRPKNPLSTVLAGMALAATVLVPGVAWSAPPPADPPLITDPAGDAGLVCGMSGSLIANCGATVPQPARPALDIVAGDINLDSTDLVFETTVVDLDDPSGRPGDVRWYTMTAVTGNVQISLLAERRLDGTPSFGTATVAAGGRATGVVVGHQFDHAANTLRWTASLAKLNDAITHLCPSCRELRRGSTLGGIAARTRTSELFVSYDTDAAFASRPYTIGDD